MRSIEDIILEKKYDELSPEELVLVSELAENEEEFNQMKQLFDNMNFGFGEEEVLEANPQTKSSLDSIFAAKHPVIANDWKKEDSSGSSHELPGGKIIPFYSRNWIRVAAVLLVFLGISVLYIENSEDIQPKSKVQQAKAEAPAEMPADKSSVKEVKSTESTATTTVLKEEKEKVQLAVASTPVQTEVTTRLESSGAKDFGTQWNGYTNQANAEQQVGIAYTLSPATASSINTYAFSTSIGLDSDLFPNGKSDDKKGRMSGSSDVPAADMLDWIQAAY